MSFQSSDRRHDRRYCNVLPMPELVQQVEVQRDRLTSLARITVVAIVMKVSDRSVREAVARGNLSEDSSMDFAELAFAYPPADRLLSSCCWTHSTCFSAQALMVYSVSRAFLTLNVRLNKVGNHVLTPQKQRVRHRAYGSPAGCNDAMQAIQKRQPVQPDDRQTQGCPTLTLKRGCICQYWFIRLPLWSEGAA